MRDLSELFITNLDVPETAFNEKALEKPAQQLMIPSKEEFLTKKAQQDETLELPLLLITKLYL